MLSIASREIKMNRLSELLGIKKLLVCDGAWGTMLQNKGLKPGECPELLNLTYPKLVKEIPEAYSKAGAELVKTNSFGGNKYRLSHYSLERKIFEINKTAAEISKDGVKDKALILGSIGPSGVILMMGDTSEEEMYETYSIQASALEAGGADALLIETFSDIQEAIIAIKAAKDNTNLEIISTFTFEKTIDGDFKTMMGYTPTQICEEVEKAGIGYIGTNCGNGFEAMAYIIKEFKEKSELPLVVNANAGLPTIRDKGIYYPETPEYVSSIISKLVEAGASIIGGCCGTTPQHINEIRRVIDIMRSKC